MPNTATTTAPVQESALDSIPPEDRPGGSASKPKRKRAWCVVKIQDYRLQSLAPADPEFPTDDLEWCELGGETYITTDREEAFKTARSHQGLLMSADGLPTVGRATAFKAAVQRAIGEPF